MIILNENVAEFQVRENSTTSLEKVICKLNGGLMDRRSGENVNKFRKILKKS